MTEPKETTHNINLDKIEEYGKKFPEHMIIGKALHYRGIRVEISHIDNDGNSPLDYLKAFQILEAMIEPTHQDWAKRFAKACRIKPQEAPNRECLCMEKVYPVYLNPQDILDEVMKWDNSWNFIGKISGIDNLLLSKYSKNQCVALIVVFLQDIITERPPTRLLKEATLWRDDRKR